MAEVPSGRTSRAGGCPARAKRNMPLAGSYTAMTSVAKASGLNTLMYVFIRARIAAGEASTVEKARTAPRRAAIVVAAGIPWPATSPITMPTRGPGSERTSDQSPATPHGSLAERQRAAKVSPQTSANRSGR